MKSSLLVLLCILVCSSAWALDTKISQSQILQVELLDQASNVEVKNIRVRDVDSQKIAQLSLKKRKDNARVWSGFFVIQFFKGDNAPRTLEFFAQDKPFLTYVQEGARVQRVLLFTSAQDHAKYIEREALLRANDPAKKTEVVTKTSTPVSQAVIEQQVREQVKSQEQMQISIEEEQAKKRAEQVARLEVMSKEEKRRKQAQAQSLVQKADELYQKQDFDSAADNYEKATELDPENDSYYYRYGVSLYKSNEFNKSLAALSIADVNQDQAVEKDYYIALNHLKLKDYDKALKKLKDVQDENDPNISPTAAFFAGTIEYQQQKFPAARKSIEYVLDNSKDTQMDKAAEEMLEQIDRMETFYASKNEKYRFIFFAGPVYDQNVLNVATNNVATDVQAYRVNYGASALGVWYRSATSDLGTQLSVSDYYSTDNKFQGNATLQTADPLEFAFTVPFHKEFVTKDRSYNWELVPAIKSIYMSPSGGTRSEIIRSSGLSTSLATPLRRDWYVSAKIDVFVDQSYLTTTSSDDDQSGKRYSVSVTPTKLLDLKGEKSISTDISYLINQTDGKNYRYNRVGFGVTYGFPGWWKSNASLRAEYAMQSYGEATTTRTDNTAMVTASMSKDLTKRWNLATTLQYTMAQSELETYKYNKLMAMGIFTYTLSILDK
ncbi:MAG TPA: tetratricopeptide repeat protein [Bdellovibrio sp.]